jgi:autotransporter-associated beta strand protein
MKYLRAHQTFINLLMIALMAFWQIGRPLQAASFYWDSDATGVNNVLTGAGLGGAGTWNTTGLNWWNGSNLSPGSLSAWTNLGNDTAIFTGTAGTITPGTPITVGGLQFNTTAFILGAAANTNAITFGTNSNIVLNNVAAATINGSLAGAGNVTLTGGAFGGVTAGTLTLSGTGSGLTGYTGTTTINNGMTMALTQNSQALASTTGITLNGGNITLTNTTLAEAGLNRIANGAGITSNGGTLTVTNTVAAATPYSETIGSVALTSGRLNITSTNANTGGTQSLILGGLTRTGAANSSTVAFSAGTAFGATNQITVSGAGTTTAGQIVGPWATGGTAANAQTDYIVYNTGNVALANIAASAETTWGTTYALGNNYTFTTNVGNTTATRNINSLRYTGAGGTIMTLNSFNLNTYGILQAGNTATATIAAAGSGALSTPTGGGNLFLTTGGGFGLTISAPINDNGGAVTPVISGSNTITLGSTTSNYSGGTVINSGTLSIGANTNLGVATGGLTFNNSGGLTFTAATTVGTAATPGNRAIALNNGALATITTGAFNSSLIGNISGTGGIILAGNSGNTLTIGQTGSTSTYTGPTVVNLGTLRSGVANAFGNNSAVTLANVAGTVLDITGFNTAIGSLSGGGTTGGNVTLGAATLTVGGNNENTTYAGVISGTNGVLTKTGNGILTLTGTSTYTGGTNLNGGLANITALANLGTAGVTFNGGGVQFASPGVDLSARTLTFSAGGATFDTNNNQVIFANAIGNSGAGGLTKAGAGTLVLAGANTYTGVTTVRNGTLALANAQALGLGASGVTVQNNASLVLVGGLNFGTKALTLNGTGALAGRNGALVNAAGANTYGGQITLGSASVISVDNGTLDLSNAGNVTGAFDLTLGGSGNGTLAAGLATGTGGLVKTGAGTWNLTGTGGTNTGTLSLTGGTLNLTAGALGVLTGATLGGGALGVTGGSQTLGNLTVSAGTANTVTAGAAATADFGSTITRGAGGTVAFDISAVGAAIASSLASGSVLGYATVNDGTTGMAITNGTNIVRMTSFSGGTLLDGSNNAASDFTTLGSTNPLAWSNGITTRSVNSLTFDASAGSQIVNMGAVSNVLSLTSGAIQKINANDATLFGGQIGANNSEVIVQQNGTGTLFLNSPVSSGTGSLTKLGNGTLQLTGGLSTATGTLVAGNTTVTVASTAGLSVGQTITGGGIPAGTTIASITNGTEIVLSSAPTTSMASSLTFGIGSTYTGATIINGGTVKAGSSSQFLTATANSNLNVAGYVTSTGGPLGIGSAVTLANVSGAALDVNGFNVAIGSLSGGGATGGNLLLSNGGSLIVGGGNLINNISTVGQTTTFGGLVSGTGNLTLTGGGALALTNSNNSFSGQVNVNSGTLVVSGNLPVNTNSALGNSNTVIAVNGVASGALNGAGLPGGTLLIQGGLGATGVTVDRNLSISGRGNNAVGGALINIGNNTYNGIITTSNSSETRVGSVAGTWTLGNAGALYLGTAGNAFYTTIGAGNIVLNGVVSGGALNTSGFYMAQSGVINKTLVLNNYNNKFIGDVRADGGTIRISNGAALGQATALGNASKLRANSSAGFEIRTDAPGSFGNISSSAQDTQIGFVLDRSVGGAGLGTQTISAGGVPTYVGATNGVGGLGNVTFGTLITGGGGGRTVTFAGRNGYGASFSAPASGLIASASNGDNFFNNNSNGVIYLDGSFATSSDGTRRTFSVNGNGETVITGFIRNTSNNVNFTKAGQGTLALTGTNTVAATASNFVGSTNITGTLLLSGSNATIGNASGGLLNGVAGGALQFATAAGGATSAAFGALDYRGPGETTAKTINLGGTGAGIILANQSGATPLVFSTSAVGAGGGGSKSLFLGGSNTAANEIAGVITNNSGTNTTSLVKFGSGTWLYDPAPATYSAGAAPTWVSGGTANSRTFVVSSVANIGLGSAVTGSNIPAGSVVTAIDSATNTVTISNFIGTALAAGTFTFGPTSNFTGSVSVVGGTLQVRPTAATGNGANLFTTAQNLIFNADNGISNGFAAGTFQLGTPSATLGADLTQTMGLLQVSAGAGRVQVDSGNTAFNNILRFNGYTTRTAGATVNFAPASTLAGIQFAVVPIAVSGGILSGSYLTAPSGSIDFVATPAVNTNIAALNSATTITGAGSATTNNLVNASIATAGAYAANTLRITGSGAVLSLGGALTMTATNATTLGGIMFDNGSGAATIQGAFNIGASTAGQELLFIVDGAGNLATSANALTVGTVGTSPLGLTTIGNGSASALTKSGAGMLILNSGNTYTGNTTINGGTVRLGGGTTPTLGTISTAGNVTTIRQGATLDVNNSGASAAPFTGATALNTTTIGALAGAGTLDNTSATASAVSLGLNGTSTGTQNFAGTISNSGGGALTVIVGGTAARVQSLTGLNTYTGATVIRTGTLQVNSLANGGVASSIGQSSNAAANLVFNNGTLQYTGNTTTSTNIYQTTQTPSVSIDRLFTLEGNATLDSSGTYGNVVAGARAANSAALIFNNTGAIAYSTTGNKVLTLQGDSTGDNQINLQLVNPTSGTLGVTKTGAGHWILGGLNNTYTGTTTITQGQLVAQDAGSNATSATTLEAGTSTTDFYVNSTNGLSIGQAVTAGGSGTIAAILDSQHVRLSSAQTIAANTALTFGSINSLSSGNLLFNQGTNTNEAILESVGTFTRTIGTGANQVQWGANQHGGFAAYSSPLTVTFGGSANFGTGGIGNGTGELQLNSTTALSDVTVSGNLNLNGGVRTIRVFDNGTTNTDYATVSGIISGGSGSGLIKQGGGVLYLTGANTYTGNTTLSAGTTIVTTIGGGSTAASAFGDGSGQLNLGGGTLIYAGTGETSARQINFNASNTIDASGSGPLILTNFVNNTPGAKTLTLRGFSNDANQITQALADNVGALTLSKQDGGTWIINGASTFSGGINNIGSGFLGITGASTAFTGTITTSNSGIFATNAGGLTIGNAFTIASNTSLTFTGGNSITLNGNIAGATGNPWQIVNTISGGTLTLNGNFNNGDAATGRTVDIRGTGNTFWNGILTTSGAATGLGFNTSGTVTIGGSTASVVAHTSSTFLQGRVINSRAGNLNPFGSASILAVSGGSLESTVALTGANALAQGLRLDQSYFVITGSQSIDFSSNATATYGILNNGADRILTNNLSGGATLTFSGQEIEMANDGNSRTLTLAGSGIYNISTPIINGSTATGSAFRYSGTGALNITNTNTYGGATTYNGGVVTLSGAAGNVSNANATGAITVANTATLTLDNATAFAGNRLNNKPITLTGATLNFIGNSLGTTEGTASNATSTLTIGSGQSIINLTNNGGTTQLNLASLTTSTGGFTNFTSNAQLGTATNRVILTTAPTLSPATTGILARATVSGTAVAGGLSTAAPEFATYHTNGLTANTNGIQAFAAYNVPTLSTVITGGTTATVASTAGLTAGMAVFGSGIPAGTTILAVTSPTTYTLSAASTNATVPVTYGSTAYTNINLALIPASTDTIKIGAGFITTDDLNANRSFNAINIVGTGINLGSVGGNATLTLTSGGLIVSGGANTLSVARVALGAEGAFHINTGASLNITGSIVTGTAGLNKNLAGSLNFDARQFYTGTTTVNNGTLQLASGVTNTLFFNNALTVNNGATLDLNGTTQFAGNFTSGSGVVPGAGGTVTTSNGTGNLISNAANGTWAGSITDAAAATTNFARLGANRLTMNSSNTYKGTTSILGGIIRLESNGTLANTSALTINYGTLELDNNAGLLIDNTNRVNDAAAISMSGGTISFNSRPNSNSSEVLGALTVAQGANWIISRVQTLGQYQTGDLSFASLTRSVGTTINFTATTDFTTFNGTLGSEGSNPRILFTSPLANSTTTNALGAWAIVNGTDYAAYNDAQGVGAVGTSGYIGYTPGYVSGGALVGFASGAVTEVLARSNQAITLPSGTSSTSLLKLTSAVAGVQNDILFASNSDKLNLIDGGLLRSNISAGSLIGNQTFGGILTAGPAAAGTTDLVTYVNNTTTAAGTLTAAAVTNVTSVTLTAATTTITPGMMVSGTGVTAGTYVTSVSGATIGLSTGNTLAASAALTFTPAVVINSSIQDVGGGSLTSLVKSGAGMVTLTNANTYTGGTVVNQGTLNLASLGTGSLAQVGNAANVVIPGNLTINGGTQGTGSTVTMLLNAGQIAATSNVTINGKGTLTLAGGNALNNTTFDNTLASLTFNNIGGESQAPTVTNVAGSTLMLTSSSPITATSMNANTASTVTGGFLALATGSNTIAVAPIQLNGVTYAPLVSGLTIASVINGASTLGSVSVTSSNTGNANVTVASVPGTLVVGSTLLGQTVTAISGSSVTLSGNASQTIASATTVAYRGSTAASLTKTGNGLLQLSGVNTFTGGMTVSGGGLDPGGATAHQQHWPSRLAPAQPPCHGQHGHH